MAIWWQEQLRSAALGPLLAGPAACVGAIGAALVAWWQHQRER